jgi:hypothetical protein
MITQSQTHELGHSLDPGTSQKISAGPITPVPAQKGTIQFLNFILASKSI